MKDYTPYHDRRMQPKGKPPREHYSKKQGRWKPKQPFSTEHKAKHWLCRHWWLKHDGYTIYRCSICGCWHVGKDISQAI